MTWTVETIDNGYIVYIEDDTSSDAYFEPDAASVIRRLEPLLEQWDEG